MPGASTRLELTVYLCESTGAEPIDAALYPVASAIGSYRIDRIVVSRLRTEALHAHTENRIRMVPVYPDRRLRSLAQFVRIRAIVHDSVMLVRSARVVSCPRNNGGFLLRQFELRAFRDSNADGFWSRRRYCRTVRACLSRDCVAEEQAADHHKQQFHMALIHIFDLK